MNPAAIPQREDVQEQAQGFLSGPVSSLVDLLRIGGCLAVIVCHSRQVGFHAGTPYVSDLGSHYAVVVFFVVSGLAIATSALRPGATLADYALSRAARLLPVALLAMALGVGAFLLRGAQASFPGHDQLTWQSLVHPLLFLTETPQGQVPVWNAPWWSLSYEVWYYALFGAAVFLRGPQRVLWLVVLAALAGPLILLLMPVWLMGVALAGWPGWVRLQRRGGVLLLIAAGLVLHAARIVDMPALAWLEAHSRLPLVNSQNVVGNMLVGLAVAMGLAGARPWLALLARPIAVVAPALRWGAGMTFTAYLMHHPLLCLARSWGLRAPPGPFGAVIGLVGLLAVCALLADLGERRSPLLRRRVQAWLAARHAPGTLHRAPTRAATSA
ncbi:MAG TPA: acyltransferase [Novosphingobium sp.]|nr:acyltransferase [Novosphingobium sp.]